MTASPTAADVETVARAIADSALHHGGWKQLVPEAKAAISAHLKALEAAGFHVVSPEDWAELCRQSAMVLDLADKLDALAER